MNGCSNKKTAGSNDAERLGCGIELAGQSSDCRDQVCDAILSHEISVISVVHRGHWNACCRSDSSAASRVAGNKSFISAGALDGRISGSITTLIELDLVVVVSGRVIVAPGPSCGNTISI
jgi:hypothetical protein